MDTSLLIVGDKDSVRAIFAKTVYGLEAIVYAQDGRVNVGYRAHRRPRPNSLPSSRLIGKDFRYEIFLATKFAAQLLLYW